MEVAGKTEKMNFLGRVGFGSPSSIHQKDRDSLGAGIWEPEG